LRCPFCVRVIGEAARAEHRQVGRIGWRGQETESHEAGRRHRYAVRIISSVAGLLGTVGFLPSAALGEVQGGYCTGQISAGNNCWHTPGHLATYLTAAGADSYPCVESMDVDHFWPFYRRCSPNGYVTTPLSPNGASEWSDIGEDGILNNGQHLRTFGGYLQAVSNFCSSSGGFGTFDCK